MRILPILTAFTLSALPALAQQASVAGTDGTHALGSIPCAASSSGMLETCPAELLRKGDGKATLRVLMPGGRSRTLYIEGGKVASSDSTEAVRGTLNGGIYYAFIGEQERFEIPEAALK